MALQSINPATEETLAEYPPLEPARAGALLEEAYDAAARWRATAFADRAALLRRAAEVLRAGAGRYASLITAEMGKPIVEAEAEIEKCAWNCDYYAEHAAHFLADEQVATPARESYVAFEPLGVVLAIMPWNFPFWQVFRFAAPALMAGNGALLSTPRTCRLRAGDRGGLPRWRASRRRLPHAAAREQGGRGADRRSAHRRRHADRER